MTTDGKSKTLNKEAITEEFKTIQSQICLALEQLDGKAKFTNDEWTRPEGGGGITKVIQKGDLLEKGGVNFSAVWGVMPEVIRNALKVSGLEFYATGVSIVLHPINPWVPIIHMNIRYFEMDDGTHWFGGGIDLTPHYILVEDAKFFHQSLKDICDKHDISYYPSFKKWADDYFYIRHREETRGIGGIFFDRLSEDSIHSKSQLFDFVKDVGNVFIPIYSELANRNRNKPYSEENIMWRNFRRGRYVEFNLVYDKGTKFGLQTHGRIESILMSLPAVAEWPYNYYPEEDTEEYSTLQLLKKGIKWV